MGSTSTLYLLQQAQEHGYAVAAFSVFDQLSMHAMVEAANRSRSPVILQASCATARTIGIGLLTDMYAAMIADSVVPVALQLDRCQDPELVEEVINAGWSSIGLDASGRDYADAVSQTSDVAHYVHVYGTEVETEIEINAEAYSVEQVVVAAEASCADMIAPRLGTVGGVYTERPQLLIERVRQFRKLTDKPIVLLDGSGLAPEEYRAFIEAGVSKVNISTALEQTYRAAALESLRESEQAHHWTPREYFRDVTSTLIEMARGFFEIFGSTNRISHPLYAPGIEARPSGD